MRAVPYRGSSAAPGCTAPLWTTSLVAGCCDEAKHDRRSIRLLNPAGGCRVPITALSSVYGMNIIVNDRTDFAHLAVVLAAMIAISIVLLRWAKRQGWW
jgi:hypothetical protein